MIRVNIDLITFGTGSQGKRLYTLNIYNDGTGDERTGFYDVELLDKEEFVVGRAKVQGYARQENPAYELVRQALNALVGR